MNTIYKILENVEVKKVGERQYEFTASTADMDRDGEVIDVEGWDLKNFKKNPVIMYAHDYRTLPIGKATHIGVKDGKLKNTVEFPPEGTYEFADIVERLVNTGYLKTESVGFIPRKWEDGEGGDKAPRRTYTKQELLEISIVPVPSNPNALMNAVTDGIITTKQFESITNKNLIDDIINAPIVDLTEGNVTKPEETDEYYRIPVPGEEGKHTDHKIRTMDVSKDKGIKGLYCIEDKKIITYMFDKDKWESMSECREWMKEHMGKATKEVSQEEIKDEIDYLITLIDKGNLSNDVKDSLQYLAKRIPGSDIPVEIEPTVKENLTVQETITYQEIREAIKRIIGGKSC